MQGSILFTLHGAVTPHGNECAGELVWGWGSRIDGAGFPGFREKTLHEMGKKVIFHVLMRLTLLSARNFSEKSHSESSTLRPPW